MHRSGAVVPVIARSGRKVRAPGLGIRMWSEYGLKDEKEFWLEVETAVSAGR